MRRLSSGPWQVKQLSDRIGRTSRSKSTGLSAAKDTPAKIKDAAEQFEGLLIAQLLKTSREAGSSGWMGTGDDQAGQIGMEMAEQSLARSMSSHGGLGLSAVIAKGLQKSS